jgi:hypothetical protein
VSITSESYWGRESNPPALVELGAKLRAHYKLSAGAIGIKGNTAHLAGYHRSANWVRNSAYCTSRSYSVTETAGNRKPTNADWCCAIDATLPHDEFLAACRRLDKAVRAGLLEKITEWYGNDDGDNRVDGYDNIRNVVASSDSSHLWHLHMSFDRGRVGEDHTDVFEILTGETMALTDADVDKIVAALTKSKTFLAAVARACWTIDIVPAPAPPYANADFATNTTWGTQNSLAEILRQGRETAAAIKAGVVVEAQVNLTPEAVAAVADATADEIHADPERDGA